VFGLGDVETMLLRARIEVVVEGAGTIETGWLTGLGWKTVLPPTDVAVIPAVGTVPKVGLEN